MQSVPIMHVPSNFRRRFALPLLAAVVVAALSLSSGCEPTVGVLNPSDQFQFSIYGALNVAADTQVIRVEPLGDSTQIGAPPDIDATVVLENLDTGETVTMRDSFAVVGPDDDRFHNFWTTHPIQPATTYRIAVQRDGETVTSATTTTPARAPELQHDSTFYLPCTFPTFQNQRVGENTFTVTARNVESIAAAQAIYPITYEDRQTTLRTLNDYDYYDRVRESGDVFDIFIFYRPALVNLNPFPPPPNSQACVPASLFTYPYALVAVAAGGPDWPEWRRAPIDEIARPDTFSNVQGGHGFIAGVYSDTIKVPIADRPSPAELRER